MRPARLGAVLALLAAGCALPERPWRFTGAPRPADWDARLPAAVAAVRTVTQDGKRLVRHGGDVVVHDTAEGIDAICRVGAPFHAAGCAATGRIDVLLLPSRGIGPDLYSTALLHELCHLGLERGGGMFGGPVIPSDEATTDACGAAAAALSRETAP